MTLLSKEHIICANTGDSRAVLCRAGEAVALSYDHKPYNPVEKERIENAGSHVKFNRVNGAPLPLRAAPAPAPALLPAVGSRGEAPHARR